MAQYLARRTGRDADISRDRRRVHQLRHLQEEVARSEGLPIFGASCSSYLLPSAPRSRRPVVTFSATALPNLPTAAPRADFGHVLEGYQLFQEKVHPLLVPGGVVYAHNLVHQLRLALGSRKSWRRGWVWDA